MNRLKKGSNNFLKIPSHSFKLNMFGNDVTGPYGTNCIISYIASFVLFMGILLYLYYLIRDFKDDNYLINENNRTFSPGERSRSRTAAKNTWIIGLFILMILMFFNIIIC